MPLVLGGIVMWSGTIENIPTGWKLCDGTEGTVDLRDKFIVGAGNTYAVEATGGSANAVTVAHTHTGATNTSSNHNHSIGTSEVSQGTVNGRLSGTNLGSTTLANNGNHSHTLTINSSGSSATNANLPPYFALAFIQQIS